jgi:SAM-dependent methyltransferase
MMQDLFSMTCPACAKDIVRSRAKAVPYPQSGGKKHKFPQEICFCASCGLGIAQPVPGEQELADFYGQGEYWGKTSPRLIDPRYYPGAYANARARWEFIYNACPDIARSDITLLDVGAGQGLMGWVAACDPRVRLKAYHAVEQDRHALQSLQTTWAARFPSVSFDGRQSLPQGERMYDLVVLSHVLEHVPQPSGLLKSLRPMLKPGARVMADVPFGDHVYRTDVFPHVLFFNDTALKAMAERSGYSVLRMSGFGVSREQACRMNKPGLMERLIFKVRGLLPLGWLSGYYARKWRPELENRDGVWLRAIFEAN